MKPTHELAARHATTTQNTHIHTHTHTHTHTDNGVLRVHGQGRRRQPDLPPLRAGNQRLAQAGARKDACLCVCVFFVSASASGRLDTCTHEARLRVPPSPPKKHTHPHPIPPRLPSHPSTPQQDGYLDKPSKEEQEKMIEATLVGLAKVEREGGRDVEREIAQPCHVSPPFPTLPFLTTPQITNPTQRQPKKAIKHAPSSPFIAFLTHFGSTW
jgi:hypothetical protein